MALSEGDCVGPYTIVGPLGAGGMGEVYRATDARLGRSVALKLLPEALARDSDRLARFEREAKVLASLSHPNIATLFGLEQASDQRVLVMELVEGEDLAERLRRGLRMPIEEAIPIARQIAEALEEARTRRASSTATSSPRPQARERQAHSGRQGEGARLWARQGVERQATTARSGSEPASVRSPPRSRAPSTEAGLILGTAAYMSPEQARGKAVDMRRIGRVVLRGRRSTSAGGRAALRRRDRERHARGGA